MKEIIVLTVEEIKNKCEVCEKIKCFQGNKKRIRS